MKLQKTIVLLLAGTAMTTATALAQQVGTATAVNPETRTTPPGGATVVLKVGAHVMHKERIKTTPTGSVQLLFLDRSTLTVAPNSDIVIDEFVYNPANGSGHMAVSLAKRAMRLVGGHLSHAGEATVNAGNATIGIRGGTGIFTTKEVINQVRAKRGSAGLHQRAAQRTRYHSPLVSFDSNYPADGDES